MARQSSSNAGRAAELLILLSQAGPRGMSLGAIATACDEARSSVHRTLVALADYGFVVQDGNRGNYRLGPEAYALSHRTPSVNDIVATYRPALIEMTAKTQLSTYLMMRSGLDTVCLDQQIGQIFAQPYVSGIGGRLPLGAGIAGVVILSGMEAKSRDRSMELLADTWVEWGVSRELVLAEIAQCRENGYLVGVRRSHGIESLTVCMPLASDTWQGFEAAVSILAPLNLLSEAALADAIETMKQAIKRAEDQVLMERKI